MHDKGVSHGTGETLRLRYVPRGSERLAEIPYTVVTTTSNVKQARQDDTVITRVIRSTPPPRTNFKAASRDKEGKRRATTRPWKHHDELFAIATISVVCFSLKTCLWRNSALKLVPREGFLPCVLYGTSARYKPRLRGHQEAIPGFQVWCFGLESGFQFDVGLEGCGGCRDGLDCRGGGGGGGLNRTYRK